jgi:4-hydroxy-tetrahydrodipicolinate synthase
LPFLQFHQRKEGDMAIIDAFRGILPAMQVPFEPDYRLDELELRRFSAWLASHEGIGGLVTNGHTGEVFALSASERAAVTRIVVDAVSNRLPVISGICCEGINEAVEHAEMAKDAGASGLLIMPPHTWLRFGMRDLHVIDYFSAIGEAVNINLVVHVYPAWTKARYSSQLLANLASLPWVTTFKVGTREMSKYDRDILAIRGADETCTILTCHDEYLLASLVQGVDGALVGFASFIPEMITALYKAVQEGDLKAAQDIQARIFPLKDVVYGRGEPTGDAHARMKTAMVLSGRLKANTVRRPTKPPTGEAYDHIVAAVRQAGLLHKDAA